VETILLIGIGGFIGANVRYLVALWAAGRFGSAFPWGTLIINFSGSSVLGLFVGWSANHVTLDPRVRLFVAIGFFGAYTTFSTYANESVALMQAGRWLSVLANVLGTNLVCILGALFGLAVGSRF
jgi:CrcB protein